MKSLIYQNKIVLTIMSTIISLVGLALFPTNKVAVDNKDSNILQINNSKQLLATRICKYYRVTRKSYFYTRHRHRTSRYLKPNVIVRVTRISDNGRYAKVHYNNSGFTRNHRNHGWIRSSHLSCFKRN